MKRNKYRHNTNTNSINSTNTKIYKSNPPLTAEETRMTVRETSPHMICITMQIKMHKHKSSSNTMNTGVAGTERKFTSYQ